MLIPLLLTASLFVHASRSPVPSPAIPLAQTQLTFTFITPPPVFSRDLVPRLTPVVPDANSLDSEEDELMDDINAERIQRGLNSLAPDPRLEEIARGHSQEMSALNYFSHRSPTKAVHMPIDRYLSALRADRLPIPSSVIVGENLYYSSVFRVGDTVSAAHQALMDSPDHQAVILDRRFARVGIGVYHDASGHFWVTEMFLAASE